MIRTNIYMDEGQKDRLNELAKQNNLSQAELIRRLLEFGLKLYDLESSLSDVVHEAMNTFDDVETPERAFERMGKHWLHNRQSNSIRGSLRRIEKNLGIKAPEEKDVQ